MSMLSKALRKTGLNKPLKFATKAAPYVAGAALIPGVGGAIGKGISLVKKIPGADKVMGAVGAVRKATGGKPITLKNTLGGIAGAVRDNPEYLAAGALGLQALDDRRKADRFSEKQIRAAEEGYAEREDLRTQGLAGLKNTARPDLSSVYSDPTNPFGRPTRPAHPPKSRSLLVPPARPRTKSLVRRISP
jgi:hypothetical protein